MEFNVLIFYAFAVVLLGASLAVVLVRNPVHAALWLVLAFFTAAAIWLLLYAEFLAITLVLVYVGAVMVLFLFVVMMLDIDLDVLRQGFWKNAWLAAVVAVAMASEMWLLIWRGATGAPAPGAPAPGFSNTKALGSVLYTDYVFPFEIAAVILLVAMVAAIALTYRGRKGSKYQDAATQLAVKPSDRLKIIKLAPDVDKKVTP